MMKLFNITIMVFLALFAAQSTFAEKGNRKIAVQSYSFRLFTYEELAPMMKSIGVQGLGCSGGMEISKKYPKVKFGPDMTDEQKAFVREIAKKYDLKFVSYGVVSPQKEEQIERIAKFAKEMGINTVITESPEKLLPCWEKNCEKYGIRMAIHNHAKEVKNGYWNPEKVAKMIAPFKHIYACADNGHWSRAQVKSLDGYNTLKGRLAVIHFKDQKEFGNPRNQPVVFGTGQLNCKELLKALDAQGYDDYFVIEYEANWENNLALVQRCAEFLKNN